MYIHIFKYICYICYMYIHKVKSAGSLHDVSHTWISRVASHMQGRVTYARVCIQSVLRTTLVPHFEHTHIGYCNQPFFCEACHTWISRVVSRVYISRVTHVRVCIQVEYSLPHLNVYPWHTLECSLATLYNAFDSHHTHTLSTHITHTLFRLTSHTLFRLTSHTLSFDSHHTHTRNDLHHANTGYSLTSHTHSLMHSHHTHTFDSHITHTLSCIRLTSHTHSFDSHHTHTRNDSHHTNTRCSLTWQTHSLVHLHHTHTFDSHHVHTLLHSTHITHTHFRLTSHTHTLMCLHFNSATRDHV